MPHDPCVYVIDDDDAVRDNLKWLLNTVDLRVSAFASATEFLEAFSPAHPGCIVLDVRMPGMSGLELQAQLADRADDFPVVFITGHGDVQMAVRTMKLGAVDFIEKPFNNQVVIDTVQRALAGINSVREARRKHADSRKHLARLTERERQVLDGIIAGETNKVMASRLSLSEKTIEVHRSRMMEKMHANSLVDLIKAITSLD